MRSLNGSEVAEVGSDTRAGTREDTNIIWITLDHEGSHKRKNDV
ncbi:MAG TPA: hypothetical protein VNB78_02250 [Sphingomicrobium sp.]|jgi:hypothetical protein|nr:hypothetical protein [Sphingomicrobium sp.]